jgi:glycosyltransferase involved in cell wall biosynthesis
MQAHRFRPLVVIPALNEQETIGEVVAAARLSCSSASILVVDDGSVDGTAAIAYEAGAVVAPHAVNLGVGAAMRTGFIYALRHGHDAVVQIDGDGQHDPEQIGMLLDGLGDCDVVVGSRFGSEQAYRISRIRRLVIRLLSRVVSVYCRTRITDATSGFRAAGPRAIRLFARHYPSEYLGDTVESLVLAGKVGLTVREVPVTMHARQRGRPSQSIVSGTLNLVRASFVVFQSFIRGVPRGAREIAGVDR